MATLRNPLAGFVVTILAALGLTFLVAVPTLFVPFFELRLIVLGFAALGVGAVAGRSSLLGSIGFAGGLVGGFFGTLLFQLVFWPTGWEYPIALLIGTLCALGGGLTGKLGLRRVERMIQSMPRARRCQRCGARVGLTARKCWSCRAYLPPT